MNRQLLQAAKKNGTVLALTRDGASGNRDKSYGERGCVPVVLTSLAVSKAGYGGTTKTVCHVRYLPDRLAEVTVTDDRDKPHVPDELLDDGTIARFHRDYNQESRPITEKVPKTFDGIEFLMPWDEYVPLRNAEIERRDKRRAERDAAQAELDRRYENVERALNLLTITFERGQKHLLDPETRQRKFTPMVDITLPSAERLAEHVLDSLKTGSVEVTDEEAEAIVAEGTLPASFVAKVEQMRDAA